MVFIIYTILSSYDSHTNKISSYDSHTNEIFPYDSRNTKDFCGASKYIAGVSRGCMSVDIDYNTT